MGGEFRYSVQNIGICRILEKLLYIKEKLVHYVSTYDFLET